MSSVGSGAVSGAATGTAIAPGWGTAIGGGLGAVLGGLGSDSPDYNKIYGQIDIPALQDLINSGKVDSSALANLSVDPSTRNAQMQALAELTNEGARGGASIQSKAAQTQLLNGAATTERMNREAILQNMASRQQLGSGAELAARLAANQDNARTAGLTSAQIAGDDRSRALQAMTQAGQLGGSVRGQDIALGTTKAQATDALARWNAQNRRSAYQDRTAWQFQRAQGEAGLAPQQYQRDVNMGGALGSLAGGAYDYATKPTTPAAASYSSYTPTPNDKATEYAQYSNPYGSGD